jgi:hypothetical protein
MVKKLTFDQYLTCIEDLFNKERRLINNIEEARYLKENYFEIETI